LTSSKPQATGDISPGLTSLNRKNLPIVVTLGGEGSCYASLASILLPFDLDTNYAITGPTSLMIFNRTYEMFWEDAMIEESCCKKHCTGSRNTKNIDQMLVSNIFPTI
jgi:hypothetical protein